VEADAEFPRFLQRPAGYALGLRIVLPGAQARRALERAAHKLSGVVSIFGSRPAMQSAVALETMGRNRHLPHAEEVLAQLKGQMEALAEALGGLRQETCPTS